MDWLAAADDSRPPPALIKASALRALTFYAHTCWQLGDRVVIADAAPEEGYFAADDDGGGDVARAGDRGEAARGRSKSDVEADLDAVRARFTETFHGEVDAKFHQSSTLTVEELKAAAATASYALTVGRFHADADAQQLRDVLDLFDAVIPLREELREIQKPPTRELESASHSPEDGVYEDGTDPEGVRRMYQRSGEDAGVAAATSEASGPAATVNRGLAKLKADARAAAIEAEDGTSNDASGAGGGGGGVTAGGGARNARRARGGGSSRQRGGGGRVSRHRGSASEVSLSDIERVRPVRPSPVITRTHTKVDVHWQDGAITRRINARDLVPITHGGEHDFWPNQFVVKASEEEDDEDEDEEEEDGTSTVAPPTDLNAIAAALGGSVGVGNQHGNAVAAARARRGKKDDAPIGVVETVNHVERIARVRWLPRQKKSTTTAGPDSSAAGDDESANATSEETPERREEVSVYELREHREYCFRLGDVVLRLDAAAAAAPLATPAREEDEWEDADDDDDDASGSSSGGGGDDDDDDDDDDARVLNELASRAVPGSLPEIDAARESSSGFDSPPDAASLTWVGEIVAIRNGRVRVAWGSGAFYTLVSIRPRSRGERRSLRTFAAASLRPPLAHNPRPRRLSTPFLTPFNSTPPSLCMERPSGDVSDVAPDVIYVASADDDADDFVDDGEDGGSIYEDDVDGSEASWETLSGDEGGGGGGARRGVPDVAAGVGGGGRGTCLLYTSPSPRDA